MASSGVTRLVDMFWHERIWLPPNVTWDDLENMTVENASYASSSYLWFPIPAAFILILIRSLFTNHVFRPMGIGNRLHTVPANAYDNFSL